MDKKNIIQQELKELPLLKNQLGKPEGYQVPADYFEHLEKNILDQVSKESLSNPTSPTTLFSLPSVWGKAAAIALLLGGSLFIWQKNIDLSIAANTDLSTAEIYTYIADNLQEFDEDLLLDQVSSSQFLTSTLSEEEKDFFLDELMNDISIDLEDIL